MSNNEKLEKGSDQRLAENAGLRRVVQQVLAETRRREAEEARIAAIRTTDKQP